MNSVDERVVQMQFNNKQFESGVKESTESLKNLKKGLDLNGSAQNISNLQKVANGFSLAGIASGVESLNQKFSALGIMGITVLQNITNSAINAGKQIVSALTIDPVKQGLSEYETKINAIQTILTNTKSKGTTLTEVNKALAELNAYSDTTIYNFAEMTKNIGTFTAAGVDLKTSVGSIKGIANIAAASGASSEDASRAMYQLSQAIASGEVRLQDWNSVQNANIGGEMFKQALIDTGKELGRNVPKMEDWRESLENGWLSAEVMTATLNKFANDESMTKLAGEVTTFSKLFGTMKESVGSGWAISWENIIGDKAQATEMLTNINNAFGSLIKPSTDARNAMLSFWNTNGGRDALIEALSNAFKGLMSILKPIGEAFRDVFPATTGARLVELSESFRDLTEKFKIGDDTAEKLKTTFTGLFSVFDIAIQIVSTFVKGIASLVGIVLPAGNGILGLTSAVGGFVTSIDNTIKSSGILNTVLEKFKEVIKPIPNMFEGVGKIADVFYNLANAIAKAFGSISGNITTGLENFSFDKLFAIINGGLFAAILLAVKKFVSSLTEVVDNGKGLLGGITDILDGVKGSLEAYQNQLKAGTLMKIAIAIGILSASIVALSMVDSGKLASSLAAMSVMFGQLIGSMVIFEKFVVGPGFKSMVTTTTAMLGLSTAILILSNAMQNLAELDWGGIAKGLVSVTTLSAILIISAKLLSTTSGELIKGATGFVVFAAAILVLSEAVKKLGSIDTAELAKGLIGVGVLCSELVLFMKATNMDSMGVKTGVGILILAGALLVLSNAVQSLGSIDTETLVKGLASIGILLTQITLFVKLTGNATGVTTTAIGLTILAAALIIFSKALENMGSMSVAELAKGLTALAASLLIMGIAMSAMKTGLPGAAALLVMASALAIIAPVLKLLGSMSVGAIAKSLLTLVGVFVILGGVSFILAPLTPVMLALGAAVALLGVGCLAVGAGLLAFSAGLSAIALAGTAGAVALVAIVTSIIGLIPMFLKQVAEGLLQFAAVIGKGGPAILSAFTAILTSLIDAIATVIPKAVNTLISLITYLLYAIANAVPQFMDAGFKILIGFLKGIADNIDAVVTTAIDVMVNFIEAIASKIPDLIQAGFDLVISFINGLAEAIRVNTPILIAAMQNLAKAVLEAMFMVLTASVPGFSTIGSTIMNSGFIQGIKNKISDCVSTIGSLASSCIQKFEATVSSFKEVGVHVIDGFMEGMKSKIKSLAEAAAQMAQQALAAAKTALGIKSPSREFKAVGAYSAQGLANGITQNTSVVTKAATKSTTSITNATSKAAAAVKKSLSIKSPSRLFQELGMYSAEGFANGLDRYSYLASSQAESMGTNALDTLKSAVSKIYDVISGDIDPNPTIRPVLDLTDVKNGANSITSLLGSRGIDVSSSVNNAASAVQTTKGLTTYDTSAGNVKNGESTYSFVQNNYSPEPLSRLEIYRQTKNQLSIMKGMVTD